MTDLSDWKELFNKFIVNVEQDLIPVIKTNRNRFPSSDKLIKRYRDEISRIQEEGNNRFKGFHEVHNELCAAVTILEDKSKLSVEKMEYEPHIIKCDKRFDFHVIMSDGTIRYIEVKTIHPLNQDDWLKYQNALKDKRFPKDTNLVFKEEWLGGELYHNAYSARTKMLDYAIVMEDKIAQCLKNPKSEITFLVLCSNGFDWHLVDLENFIFFYRNGKHFPGDPFSQMEDHFIKDQQILLKGSIHCFSYFRRPKLEIRPDRVIWSVNIPNVPSWLS